METANGSGCAVVVGGSKGIGLAAARALGQAGHRLVINGRDPQTLAGAAGTLETVLVSIQAIGPAMVAAGYGRIRLADLPPEHGAAVIRGTPIQRMGTEVEVAAVIAFLASRDAGFITGHTLDVNGGAFMD